MVNAKRKRVMAQALRQKKRTKKSTSGVIGVRSPGLTGGRVGSPLGNLLKTKFRIVSQDSMNGGASGAIAVNSFQINSLYDPLGSFGSAQPRGFDQLALIFGQYRVTKAKVSLEIVNVSTTVTAAAAATMVGIMISHDSTPPGNFKQAIEQGYCVWKLLPCDQSASATLTIECDIPKFKNRTKSVDDLSAAISANPVELVYAHVFCQDPLITTDINPMAAVVTLDFDVEMFEPIMVNAS